MNMLVHCFDKLSALRVQSLDKDRLQARVAAIINSLDSARIQHGGNDYDVHVARRSLLELIRLKRPAPPTAAGPFEIAEDMLSARIMAFKDTSRTAMERGQL